MPKDIAREKGRRVRGRKRSQRRIPFGNLIKGLKLFGSFFLLYSFTHFRVFILGGFGISGFFIRVGFCVPVKFAYIKD